MVYIYIGSFIGFFASVVSMGEMASMWVSLFGFCFFFCFPPEIQTNFPYLFDQSRSPTSGGQYHWVSEFAGKSWQKFLSYITGKSFYEVFLGEAIGQAR